MIQQMAAVVVFVMGWIELMSQHVVVAIALVALLVDAPSRIARPK
jgi:hypothetical protein